MQQVLLAVQMHRLSPLLAVRTPSASLSQMLQAIALIGRSWQFRLPSAHRRGLRVPLSKAIQASMHQALLAAKGHRFLQRNSVRTPLASLSQMLPATALVSRIWRLCLPFAHRRCLRVPLLKAFRPSLQQPMLAARPFRIQSRNAVRTPLVSPPQALRETLCDSHSWRLRLPLPPRRHPESRLAVLS